MTGSSETLVNMYQNTGVAFEKTVFFEMPVIVYSNIKYLKANSVCMMMTFLLPFINDAQAR